MSEAQTPRISASLHHLDAVLDVLALIYKNMKGAVNHLDWR